MSTQTTWQIDNTQASYVYSTDSSVDWDTYKTLLQFWQQTHSGVCLIDEFNFNQMTDNRYEWVLHSRSLAVCQFNFNAIVQLSSLEKLYILQQSLSCLEQLKKEGLVAHFSCHLLLYHPQAHACWLPPTPDSFLHQNNSISPAESLIILLLQIFGFEQVENVSQWRHLETKQQIPWEWGCFIDAYLNKTDAGIDFTQLFRFIFFQAWLYNEANRLALKDKLLNSEDAARLYGFGQNLGLSKAQMYRLDHIAQQPYPERRDLIELALLEDNSDAD